jgi:quercetin dioxygenase-like cupin family protein
MRPTSAAVIGGAAIGLAGGAAALLARRRTRIGLARAAWHVRESELAFEPVAEGVMRAVLRGDAARGAYAGFLRFPPGVELPKHTHPNDISLVVVSGVYILRTDEGDRRVEPGSYLVIPAGFEHGTGVDPENGCLAYEESNAPFGIDMVGE